MSNREIIINTALSKLNLSGYVLDCEIDNLHAEFSNLNELIPLVKQAGYKGELLLGSQFFNQYSGYSPVLWLYNPEEITHERAYELADKWIKDHIKGDII